MLMERCSDGLNGAKDSQINLHVCLKAFILMFGLSGGHQTDEPTAAAQERADHQRDLSHEGKQEPQHRQLPGQVRGFIFLICILSCFSVKISIFK